VILLGYRRCVERRQQYGFAIVTVLVWGTLLEAGTLWPMIAHADTNVIPSVTASARYDTNIYFAPPERLPPGTRINDIASTVGAGAQVLHRSREVEATLTGGADLNVFVHNKGLNYINTRVEGNAILDGWVNQWVRGAKLRVSDRFRYTPESPGFLTGAGAAAIEDPFLRGIQGFRANTFANIASLEGSYPMSQVIAFEGRYSFSLLRVGSVLATTTTGAAFFNSNVHALSVGPRFNLTPADSIFLSYRQGWLAQTQSGESTSPKIETNTQALVAEYNRVMPDWTLTIGGGVTLVEPAGRAFPTASVRFLMNPERATTFQLDLTRLVTPSYYLASGANISNVGRAQLVHRLSERFSLRGSAYYAFNESVSETTTKFKNLTLSTGLSYNLTRELAFEVFYDYNDFKTESTTLNYTIYRNVVGFSLTAQWN